MHQNRPQVRPHVPLGSRDDIVILVGGKAARKEYPSVLQAALDNGPETLEGYHVGRALHPGHVKAGVDDGGDSRAVGR